MTSCPFFECDRDFACTGGARTHLQMAHDVPCNRQTVWNILALLGADVHEEMTWGISEEAIPDFDSKPDAKEKSTGDDRQ